MADAAPIDPIDGTSRSSYNLRSKQTQVDDELLELDFVSFEGMDLPLDYGRRPLTVLKVTYHLGWCGLHAVMT